MADTDGWSGPRRHDEAGLGRLMNELKLLKQQVAELQRGAALRAAGIGASPDGLTVHSSLNVDGSLAATGNTTIGGTLDVGAATTISGDLDVTGTAEFSGDTTIGGNAAITGTLSLPNGIIDNDALASPVTVANAGGGGVQTGIPAGDSLFAASIDLIVPAGFSRAVVWSVWTVAAENTSAIASRMIVGAQIGSVTPNRVGSVIPAGGELAVSGSATRLLTGLTGGQSIVSRASLNMNGGSAWTGNAFGNGDMVAVFLR